MEAIFDTIVLLTGSAEQSVLMSVLFGHNPDLTVIPVGTSAELAALPPDLFSRARLIAFATAVIVSRNILDCLGYGAYNFHPGSPQYPGWAPAHFALYDQAAEFGATVHAMVEQVDAGPIVDVARFPIPAGITVAGLEGLTYAHLAKLFWQLARVLATQAAPLPEIAVKWSGKKNSRRAYRAICDIPLTIPKEELYRRIKVFGGNYYGIAPTINLHGVEFRAVLPNSAHASVEEKKSGAAPPADGTKRSCPVPIHPEI